MPSPFPGMDPYLEHPGLWPDVHNRVVAHLGDHLAPVLRPRYYVALEERTYLDEGADLALVGRPDVALVGTGAVGASPAARASSTTRAVEVRTPMPDTVRETYLEVRTVGEGDVVTVIELLSPSNKRPGTGRQLYVEKRMVVLATRTNLVEIDLLRAGTRMSTLGPNVESDYRILVSRAGDRPRADLVPFGVRDAIPAFSLPLRPGEEEPAVEMGPLVHAAYDRAGYDLRIDYRRPATPPLEGDDADWADGLLRPLRP